MVYIPAVWLIGNERRFFWEQKATFLGMKRPVFGGEKEIWIYLRGER
jgi:hypothetical protein